MCYAAKHKINYRYGLTKEKNYDKRNSFKKVNGYNQVGCVKKIELANSALLVCVAKFVRITDNQSKSFIFCVFMTQGMKLFSFYFIGNCDITVYKKRRYLKFNRHLK